jgi:dTDP-4-dehydrorhamnose 3,5-epimerase
MKFTPLPLHGAYLVGLEERGDERGFFARLFCKDEFESHGLNGTWSQINNSFSRVTGTLRGLHFQLEPSAEVKLVRCIQGKIWDVIVDIRPNSSTFGKWHAEELTCDNRLMMYAPKGFAHGFISLTANTEIIYLVSSSYNSKLERNIAWNDPEIAITWPIAPAIISERDSNAPSLLNIAKSFNFS